MAKAKICVAGRKPHVCQRCRADILPGQMYRLVGKKRFHRSPDCDHAQPTVLDHLPFALFSEDPYWKLFVPIVWRFVRSFRRMAQVDHECWRCECSNSFHQQMLSRIFAGDEYDAEVYVSQVGWEIRRYHQTCPWDPCEDEEFDREEELEDKAEAA